MPERWPQVERIYNAVVVRPQSEWPTALAELCAGDDSLRHEVESLLAHEKAASRFLETPAFAGVDLAGDIASERALVGRRFGRRGGAGHYAGTGDGAFARCKLG